MDSSCGFYDRAGFNLFTTSPDYCYNIMKFLMTSNEDIWKLLYYNTTDALSQPNLTMEQKRNLIYTGTGDSEPYKVFRVPFLDDAFTEQTSQLRIYLGTLLPNNRSWSLNDIYFEVISHVKLSNLDNYQSRPERMLCELLSTLNGQEIGGVGRLFFDASESMYDNARANIFNNRNFFGYTLIMSVRNGDIIE